MTDTFGGKPATTITEIIHDDLPDWAIEAMAEGRFFNTAIVLFDTTIKKLKTAEQTIKVASELSVFNSGLGYVFCRELNAALNRSKS